MVTSTLPCPWKPGRRVLLGEDWIFARKRGRLGENELTRDLQTFFLLKLPEFPLPGIFLATGFGCVCVRVHRFVKYCISCLDSDLRNHIIRQVTSFPFPSFCHSWAMGVGALGWLFHTQIELFEKAFLPSPALPSVPALPLPLGLGMRLQVENCCKNIFRVCSLSRKPQRERWGLGEKRSKKSSKRSGYKENWEMGSLGGAWK